MADRGGGISWRSALVLSAIMLGHTAASQTLRSGTYSTHSVELPRAEDISMNLKVFKSRHGSHNVVKLRYHAVPACQPAVAERTNFTALPGCVGGLRATVRGTPPWLQRALSGENDEITMWVQRALNGENEQTSSPKDHPPDREQTEEKENAPHPGDDTFEHDQALDEPATLENEERRHVQEALAAPSKFDEDEEPFGFGVDGPVGDPTADEGATAPTLIFAAAEDHEPVQATSSSLAAAEGQYKLAWPFVATEEAAKHWENWRQQCHGYDSHAHFLMIFFGRCRFGDEAEAAGQRVAPRTLNEHGFFQPGVHPSDTEEAMQQEGRNHAAAVRAAGKGHKYGPSGPSIFLAMMEALAKADVGAASRSAVQGKVSMIKLAKCYDDFFHTRDRSDHRVIVNALLQVRATVFTGSPRRPRRA